MIQRINTMYHVPCGGTVKPPLVAAFVQWPHGGWVVLVSVPLRPYVHVCAQIRMIK